ncbi:MAG: endonuclease domain-containing protein [Hyphomicrobiales bacterium]|nr:endonuclease domain-containing protein [Hyphomicrobiales bacterium]
MAPDPGSSRARALRRRSTEAEKRLWHRLRDRQLHGLKFRRQVPVGTYVVDFLCYENRVVVELDGGQHGDESTRRRDAVRTSFLQERGFRVLRFWNNDVLENLEGVLQAIGGTAPSPSR